jgi:hypothetical protein
VPGRMIMADDIPPCHIRIDKEGTWYYQGLPIINTNIYLYLNQCLGRDAAGRYILSMGEERCYLDVEDTPFVIHEVYLKRETAGTPAVLWIKLNDGTEESLETGSLRVAADNVVYARIKEGFCEARFTRAAYYQLAGYLQQDREGYYLSVDGVKTYLSQIESPAS